MGKKLVRYFSCCFLCFSFCCGFVLFWVFLIVLISFFSFPASGQVQQLLRNCSMSISCVHKCCTVGLTAADPQLPSYRNCFFLSVSLLPKHCVEGWSGACMCVIFWENAAALLLENKAAIQDTRSCFFTEHILFFKVSWSKQTCIMHIAVRQ